MILPIPITAFLSLYHETMIAALFILGRELVLELAEETSALVLLVRGCGSRWVVDLAASWG